MDFKKIMIKNKKKIIAVIFLLIIVLGIWIAWGNSALMVNKYIVENDKIPEKFHGFRIAQISDLHNAEFGEGNEKLLSMLKECKPDIIVLTGDLVDSRRTDIDVSISFAKEAVLIAPVYYVTGNHESRIPEYEDLIKGIEEAGVQILGNESVLLEKSGEKIVLAGVQDPCFKSDYLFDSEENFLGESLSEIIKDEQQFTMLLSHRPEYFDVYVENNVDLVLCGHAHGGQFRLPFIGGVIAPNQGLFPKYDAGLYIEENTNMIVSRGVGNSILPFRVNNRPEIVLVELQCNR